MSADAQLPVKQKEVLAMTVEHFKGELGPGTYIPPETVEKIVGSKRHLAEYSLGVTKAAKAISAYVEVLTGKAVWVRQQDYGIRILEPKEAGEHSMHVAYSKLDQADKAFTRGVACVSPSDFDSDAERDSFYARQRQLALIIMHTKNVQVADVPGGSI